MISVTRHWYQYHSQLRSSDNRADGIAVAAYPLRVRAVFFAAAYTRVTLITTGGIAIVMRLRRPSSAPLQLTRSLRSLIGAPPRILHELSWYSYLSACYLVEYRKSNVGYLSRDRK